MIRALSRARMLPSLGSAASARRLSTKLAVVEHAEGSKVATIRMDRPPVNSLSLEMIQDLTAAIKEVETSGCGGFVLASSQPTIFSAGLDIMEMYQPDKARLEEFWSSLQAEGKFMIGLNETQLGIVAPFWFVDTVGPLMGPRATDRMLQLGQLLKPDQALQKGLVDQLEPHGDVMDAAQKELAAYVAIEPESRAASKMLQRRDALERLRSQKAEDIDRFVAFAMTDKVQSTLGAYLESLKKKKA